MKTLKKIWSETQTKLKVIWLVIRNRDVMFIGDNITMKPFDENMYNIGNWDLIAVNGVLHIENAYIGLNDTETTNVGWLK